MNLFFDLIAPLYERMAHPPDVPSLVAMLGLPDPGLMLDLAGGTGRVSRPLLAQVGGLVVCDASLPMLTQARERARAHSGTKPLNAVRARAERLPFADGAFSRVLLVDALHHFHRQDQALAELARVLAPRGRLVVSEPNIAAPGMHVASAIERLLLMDSHILPADDIAAMLADLGLVPRVQPGEGLSVWVIADRPGGAR